LAGALASSKLPDNLISCPAEFRNVHDGELIWVRLSWLRSFVKQVLPLLSSRFTLVTGDSDSCVPSEVMPEARAILASPHLAHWYTQNYDGSMDRERISAFPIGIDYHMLTERPIWGEVVSPPAEQEQTLRAIRATLPALKERIPKVYVDFAWQQSFGLRHYRRFHPLKGTEFHENRRQVARRMRKNPTAVCQTGPIPRRQMWQVRGQYAFVLSPHGMGLDCHRTWEALALGHIVLTPSSALDPLFVDLPVIALKSWNEISGENLAKWQSRFVAESRSEEKLVTSYWIRRMRSTLQRESPDLLAIQ